jgi:hypothetical protein
MITIHSRGKHIFCVCLHLVVSLSLQIIDAFTTKRIFKQNQRHERANLRIKTVISIYKLNRLVKTTIHIIVSTEIDRDQASRVSTASK